MERLQGRREFKYFVVLIYSNLSSRPMLTDSEKWFHLENVHFIRNLNVCSGCQDVSKFCDFHSSEFLLLRLVTGQR